MLQVEKWSPPDMVEIRLDDERYRHLPRIPTTLVIKRKSIDFHNGWLCARWGVVPLSVTCFVSSPTCHRSPIKIVCAIDSSTKWNILALAISHAFLHSGNLRRESRLVETPPPMVALPWAGSHPPLGADLENLPLTQNGFLFNTPLYGGARLPNAMADSPAQTVSRIRSTAR